MSSSDSRLYSAPELADELAVTPRALRFYESKGLLSPRRVGARRIYDQRDRARVQLILRGKRLGFTLAEVREYLDLYDADTTQTSQLRGLAGALRRRIADLNGQKHALEQALRELEEIFAQTCGALRQRGIDPADTVDDDLRPSCSLAGASLPAANPTENIDE
jgi:DNA-binding transcriptional MerR regulator